MNEVRSADISRAYPKARKFSESDCKWVLWPKNMIKSENMAKKIGFVKDTLLKILRPLYGTSDAGKDFVSSLAFDLLRTIKL